MSEKKENVTDGRKREKSYERDGESKGGIIMIELELILGSHSSMIEMRVVMASRWMKTML